MDDFGLYQAVVDALPSHVAVLDHRGRIVAVNRAWRTFAVENGMPPQMQWRGVSYLSACQPTDADGAARTETRIALAAGAFTARPSRRGGGLRRRGA